MNLHKLLKEIRDENGDTQADMVRKTGIGLKHVAGTYTTALFPAAGFRRINEAYGLSGEMQAILSDAIAEDRKRRIALRDVMCLKGLTYPQKVRLYDMADEMKEQSDE